LRLGPLDERDGLASGLGLGGGLGGHGFTDQS
jgi:hypothetical protein